MTAQDLAKVPKKSGKPGEYEDKYRALVEKSLVGIYVIQDGVFKFANKRFLEILGGKEKDVIGVEYTKFVAPESMDEVVRGVSKRERGEGGPKHYTFRALKKDGTKIYVEVFSVPTAYEGRPAIQGMALDITERKRVEEELKRSETKYKTLVEEMQEGLWVSDRDDRTLYWNKSLERMLGYKLDEVAGKPIYYFTTDENKKILRRELAKRRKKDSSSYELEYTSKSGKQIPVIVSGAPAFDKNGKFSGSFAVITDISERKKTERELISYTNQLKRSNMLKDLFADIVHHDFLAPLGIIRGYTELMIYEGEDGKKIEKLNAILSTVEKVVRMIEDSNKLARLETEKEPEFKKRNLDAMLDTTIDALKHVAEENNITIEYKGVGEYFADVNPVMEDVFTNLISNAIKYSPGGGKVIIDVFDEGQEWKVMVKDSGPGIPDKHKKNVFERFRRASKEGVKGTGLGLAIVERVVSLHRGKVWIEDNPKGGSIFYVTMPKRQKASDAPEKEK